MTRRAYLSLLVVLAACGGSPASTDTGSSSNADAAIDPATISAIDDVTTALGVAAALGAPLAPDGATLRTDAAPDTTAHMRAQHGFSGSSVVTPSTCATYAWSGLTAMVAMAGCTLESTGVAISGSASVTVMLRPVSFTVAVQALAVGSTTYTGNVTLHINATDTMPAPPTLDVDLTVTSGATTQHLTATGLTVTTTMSSMTIAGAASVTSGSTTTSVSATALTWQMGQCLPSSGTATVTVGSAPATTLGFLTTTPMDGRVTVSVPPFPMTTQMLFMPCH